MVRTFLLLCVVALFALTASAQTLEEIEPVIIPSATPLNTTNPLAKVVVIDDTGSWGRIPKVNTTVFKIKPKILKNFKHDPVLAAEYAEQQKKRAARRAAKEAKAAAEKKARDDAEASRRAARAARQAARAATTTTTATPRFRQHAHKRSSVRS